jgi:hypothetical protein
MERRKTLTNTGARAGYRTRPRSTGIADVIVPAQWYDARVVWIADAPIRYETSKFKDEPFKRYPVQFGIIFPDGRRERIYCTMKWPMDDVSFASKSAVWTLANTVMGEGWMESIVDDANGWLDTGAWLGGRLQVHPTVETFSGRQVSRVVIDTYKGEPHIRVAREVDTTSTMLLWEKAKGLGADRGLMAGVIREFSIPSPNPTKWLVTEQQLVNTRLQEWIGTREG